MKYAILLTAVLASMIMMGGSCGDNSKAAQVQKTSQAVTGTYQQRLENAVPYPLDQMNYSVERQNLRERLLRFNDPTKIGYVYLLNNVGNVISYYTVKGKVSSASSQLTTSQLNTGCGTDDGDCHVNDAPTDDGSYGPNEDGMFFFTTEGVLIQWNGQWLYSDYPLVINEQPIIGYDVANAAPSNTTEE